MERALINRLEDSQLKGKLEPPYRLNKVNAKNDFDFKFSNAHLTIFIALASPVVNELPISTFSK